MKNKGLIILIIIVIAGAVIYFMRKEPSAGDDLLTTTSSADSNILGKDINNALNKINSLNISTNLFRNPNFQILVDYSVAIPPQERGRENPFQNPDPSAAGTGGIVVDPLNPDAFPLDEIGETEPAEEGEAEEVTPTGGSAGTTTPATTGSGSTVVGTD